MLGRPQFGRAADCIATFGLRAGEVARLQLEDVDWRAGTIRLTRTKGRKERLLPLPQAVGEVLANYLQRGRPKSSSRSMFLSDGGRRPLFGLLACTGLRISEALQLQDRDLDWKLGTLTVRKAKFGLLRRLPLHSSAQAALDASP